MYASDLNDSIEQKAESEIYISVALSLNYRLAEMIYGRYMWRDIMVYVSRLSDEMTVFQTSK